MQTQLKMNPKQTNLTTFKVVSSINNTNPRSYFDDRGHSQNQNPTWGPKVLFWQKRTEGRTRAWRRVLWARMCPTNQNQMVLVPVETGFRLWVLFLSFFFFYIFLESFLLFFNFLGGAILCCFSLTDWSFHCPAL